MTKKKAEFNTDWFKLEKYLNKDKGLESLDAKGWYAQIQARRNLNNQIESNRQDDGSFFIVGYEGYIWMAGQHHKAVLEQSKQSILEAAKAEYGQDAKIHTNNLSWERLKQVYEELGLEHLDEPQVIKEISKRKGAYDGISWTEARAALIVRSVKRLKNNPIVTENSSWWGEALKELPNPYDGAAVCSYDDDTYPIKVSGEDNEIELVAINTIATDEQIREDFAKWLKGYREANPSISLARRKGRANEKPFDEADFYEWRKYRVIPYLDLTLIAKAEGKKIKKYNGQGQCMEKLIGYSARAIEKDVEPRAKSLLTDKRGCPEFCVNGFSIIGQASDLQRGW